jgi:hypothetical protein
LHEYQRKGLTEKAFCNSLILKGSILAILDEQKAEMAALKRKAGASSRTPNEVSYRVKYTSRYGRVKENFGGINRVGRASLRIAWLTGSGVAFIM